MIGLRVGAPGARRQCAIDAAGCSHARAWRNGMWSYTLTTLCSSLCGGAGRCAVRQYMQSVRSQ
eukprot:scaffold12322_cov110-Isochrysis_galbana.AAC.1